MSIIKDTRTDRITRNFLKLSTIGERKMKTKWRKTIRDVREQHLAGLDALQTRSQRRFGALSKNETLLFLLDRKQYQLSMKRHMQALWPIIMETAFEFTLPELGIPVFDIDDSAFDTFWKGRYNAFSKTTSKTIYRRLSKTVRDGIAAGESYPEIRARISKAYQGVIAPWKTLQIARTETAGLMNTTRDKMFEMQGFTRSKWSNAQDEKVREDHVLFGTMDANIRGFNYMELVAGDGTLRFPGDPQGPAGQVINCRCVEIPVE